MAPEGACIESNPRAAAYQHSKLCFSPSLKGSLQSHCEYSEQTVPAHSRCSVNVGCSHDEGIQQQWLSLPSPSFSSPVSTVPRCVLFLPWAPLRLFRAALWEAALAKVPGLSSGSPGLGLAEWAYVRGGALNAKFYLSVVTSPGGS